MLGWLFLLFTLLPALELYLLVQVGREIGALSTVAVVVATGFFGAWLSRREFARVGDRLREGLAQGIPPGEDLAQGLLVVVGGVLLLTPGFVTDLLGLVCLLPFTRPLLARRISRRFARGMTAGKAVSFQWGGLKVGGVRPGNPPHGSGIPSTVEPHGRPFQEKESFGGTWSPSEGAIKKGPAGG